MQSTLKILAIAALAASLNGASANATIFTQKLTVAAGGASDTATRGSIAVSSNIGTARGNAFATFGALKVFATANAFNQGGSNSYTEMPTSASYYDTMTIHGRAIGARGLMKAKVSISGNWSGQASTGAEINSEFNYSFDSGTQLGNQTDFTASHALKISNAGVHNQNLINGAPVSTILGIRYITVPFVFGRRLGIEQSMSCNVNVLGPRAGQGGTSTCNFGHSVYWAGVAEITDEDGNVVNDWTADSSSGFDYRNASPLLPATQGGVPEPGVWAMLIIGLGAVGSRMRRRHPSRAGALASAARSDQPTAPVRV